MENNIGVGLIVGLVSASSFYVWNSSSFSKAQKYILILFVLFPPLQWISILATLFYNKLKTENSIEFKTRAELSSVENNLIELKKKKIISEDEFNSKIEKIEKQKTEQKIVNSEAYKQLKKLFETGFLTKEEFENKIKSIKLKDVDNERIKREDKNVEYILLSIVIIGIIILIISNIK